MFLPGTLSMFLFIFSLPVFSLSTVLHFSYKTHHDYIGDLSQEDEEQLGNRMLTVFIYLNEVEAGGGTAFPGLNITVTPKVGRVVIWPSVLNDDPEEIDWRTEHEALPVESGMKYGANVWFRSRPFRLQYKTYTCYDDDDDEQEEKDVDETTQDSISKDETKSEL
jgi:hypothetical protein